MKGYCDLCGGVIDETEIEKLKDKFVCLECYLKEFKAKEHSLISRVAKVSCFLFGIFIIVMLILGGFV